jgi:hypothetical protein
MEFGTSPAPRTVHICRRSGRRHRLLHAEDAYIEFTLPDGRPWKLDLLEIGSGGLCFGLEDGKPLLAVGSRIDGLVVRIANDRISGAVTIAHATEEFAAGTICGARFHPATEADARTFEAVIASLPGEAEEAPWAR